LRTILSGLLAMLLLCGSSWAAACDLTCDLQRAMPACAHEAAAVSMTMEHCHGMATQTVCETQVSNECQPMACGHRVQVAERAGGDSFAFVGTASQAVAVRDAMDAPVVVMAAQRAVAVPRGDPPGFDPLFVSLRV
jgi:hypothetical protein